MPEYRIFWGESHDNTYQFADPPAPIDECLARAAAHLDFYAAAYYTTCSPAFEPGGHLAESSRPHKVPVEVWKDEERLDREWAEVKAACRAADQPGRFVTFPGYEWQGDATGGDHNVSSPDDDLPIFRVATLRELYDCLRGLRAVAIPHHTAYRPGCRGRDWSVYDERLSPYTEIYSVHGCSETDEEWVGMRQNSHMGPPVGGGTWQDALDRGYHIGAVCSTDNWGEMPGHYGRGTMACLAEELTREGLWSAMTSRRVYGVTGDRIKLDFTVDGAAMGSVIVGQRTRRIRVAVEGCDALDRIEVLRGNQVLATHCHQGTWRFPEPGRRTRFKLRIEAGWGPRPNETNVPPRQWDGLLEVPGGRLIGFVPCWITPQTDRPRLSGERAEFALTTNTRYLQERSQNADLFEFEADPAANVRIRLNGLEERGTVAELAAGSREMLYVDESRAMLRDAFGIDPDSLQRWDTIHHVAYKAKVHRPLPEAAWTAVYELEDDQPLAAETHYRVRVEQRNGQRAWSSPVWVTTPA